MYTNIGANTGSETLWTIKKTLRLAFIGCSERTDYIKRYFSFTIHSINMTNPIQRTYPSPLYRQVKRKALVPTEKEAGWAPEWVRVIWEDKKVPWLRNK